MARSRSVRSLNERPRKSATPYSVTTMSASPRGVVTGRPSSEATIRECLPSGGRRRQRDDRPAAGRRECAADEVELPADRAEIAAGRDFGIHVAGEIDLDARVDRVQVLHACEHLLVVRVFGRAHLERVVAVGEIHETAAPEEAAGDGAARVDAFARVRHDALLHEIHDHVGDDAAVDAEIAMVLERAANRDRVNRRHPSGSSRRPE